MISRREVERRVEQGNREICERCLRDDCENCDLMQDADDIYETLGDIEFHSRRDDEMERNV